MNLFANIKIARFMRSIFILAIIVLPLFVFAQESPVGETVDNGEAQGKIFGLTYECNHVDAQGRTLHGECTFADLIAATMYLVDWGTGFALMFSVIVIAWAGFNFMISGDNQSKRTVAKKALQNVVIGIVVIISAWLIVQLIVNALDVNTGAINFR